MSAGWATATDGNAERVPTYSPDYDKPPQAWYFGYADGVAGCHEEPGLAGVVGDVAEAHYKLGYDQGWIDGGHDKPVAIVPFNRPNCDCGCNRD